MKNINEVINLFKKKLKVFNINNGNFLNYAPNLILTEQFEFLKKKKLNKLIELNLFYKNKKFNKYFWNEIISYLNNQIINEKIIFKNIKVAFNYRNILEVITVYQILLFIGKFKLAFKVRKFFFKTIFKRNFFFESSYVIKLKKINNLLQNCNLIKLRQNKIQILNFLKSKKKIKIEDDYSNYIKDKSINIIGVGVGNKKNVKNFLSADVVVKFNYHSKKQTKNFHRCDASYYSYNFFLLTHKDIIEKNLNMKFMLTKKNWNVNKFKNYNVRQYKVFEDFMFGTPSLLLNCVLDLLARKPKSVKIFNSTLYYPIKSKIYDFNQKKAYMPKKKSDIVSSFGVHDRISEFLILRNLYHLKLIKVDKNLKYVLNLNLNKFLEDMEKFYKPLVLDFYKISNL
jgi:hypothetical protein